MEDDAKTQSWSKYNIKPLKGSLPPAPRARHEFCFGLEAEFIVTERVSATPLWHQELSFDKLYPILEAAAPAGLANLTGLKLEAPHRRVLPYVVEGYHVTDAAMQPIGILPKGIEIRTPLRASMGECLDSLRELYQKLDAALACHGYGLSGLSHHPIGQGFDGPQNKRRHDYWRWAVEAMHTYGPDINIGLPAACETELCADDLQAKVNYYAPALTALSLNSPLVGGHLWQVDGSYGRAYRTYRRSIIAPAIELHPDQNGRMEYKSFEMSHDLADFAGYFLLWLTLLLERGQLIGRASAPHRIYGLGRVAVEGLHGEDTRRQATQVLDAAYQVLPSWGFDPSPLAHFAKRLAQRQTPADEVIAQVKEGASVPQIMAARAQLVDSRAAWGKAVNS